MGVGHDQGGGVGGTHVPHPRAVHPLPRPPRLHKRAQEALELGRDGAADGVLGEIFAGRAARVGQVDAHVGQRGAVIVIVFARLGGVDAAAAGGAAVVVGEVV